MFLTGTGQLAFSVVNDTKLVINSVSGNVGIGVTGPTAKLEVTTGGTKALSISNTRTTTSVSLATMRSFYTFGITQFRGGVDTGLYMSNVTDNIPGIQAVNSSDNAGSLSIQPYGGNIGIGTTSPASKLDVNSNISSSSVGVITLSQATNGAIKPAASLGLSIGNGGEATNAADLWFTTASGGALSEKMRISSNGDVGIGVTSPLSKLHILDSSSTATKLTIGASGEVPIITAGGTNTDLQIQAVGPGGFLNFITGTSGASRILINSAGKVGIGTTSPAHRLQVNGDSTVNGGGKFGWVHNPGTDNNIYNFIQTSVTSGQSYAAEPLEISGARWTNGNTRGIIFTHQTSGEIMTIMTGGNVGIGDTSPSFPLVVSKSSSSTSNGADASYRFALVNPDQTNNNYALMSFSDGTAQPGSGFFGMQFTDHTNNYGDLCFGTRGASGFGERMRIKSGGNVGINKTSPAVKLDVADSKAGSTFTTGIARFENTIETSSGGAGVLSVANNYQGGFGTLIKFYFEESSVASINFNASATAVVYNTTSDYRLKEDLKSFNGLEIIDQIKTYNYKWKKADARGYGALAHELQEVFPEAVTGDKDGEDMQGVDYSTLVPVLIKSIQELKVEIESLKQQINN